MNLDDYLALGENKKKYWQEHTGNSELRVIAKVVVIKENYCLMERVKRIPDYGDIPSPESEGKLLSRVIGSWDSVAELKNKNISTGDLVFFNLQLNGKLHESKFLVKVKTGTIEPAIESEKFGSLDFDQDFCFNNDGRLFLSRRVYEEYETELSMLDEVIAEKEVVKTELKTQRVKLYKLVAGLISKIEAKEQELERYRFIDPQGGKSVDIEDRDIEKIRFTDPEQMLNYICKFLLANEKKPLYYEVDILRQFYIALKTEQILILAGSPGSGKTSLVEGFAKAIDAEFRLIPVQSNWMDKNDLLGYYNPIEKSYVSTPFLDALLEARQSKKLFFICLDEMNLSHVEYYFAEFLSKLQTDKKIQLYSKSIEKDIEEELAERYQLFTKDMNEPDIDDWLHNVGGYSQDGYSKLDNYFKVKKQIKMLQKYRSILEIPDNVRFIGTINKDETTKDFSPKMVDRSFIIMLELQGKVDISKAKDTLINCEDDYTKPVMMKVKDIARVCKTPEETLSSPINALKDRLRPLNINLNNRFDKTVEYIIGANIMADDNQILDCIFANLILPKVNADAFGGHAEALCKLLEANTRILPISKEVLKKMVVKENDKLVALTYWR